MNTDRPQEKETAAAYASIRKSKKVSEMWDALTLDGCMVRESDFYLIDGVRLKENKPGHKLGFY